jgi:hypothetical protein
MWLVTRARSRLQGQVSGSASDADIVAALRCFAVASHCRWLIVGRQQLRSANSTLQYQN